MSYTQSWHDYFASEFAKEVNSLFLKDRFQGDFPEKANTEWEKTE